MDERDVLNQWRALFRAKPISPEVLVQAESMLDGLSGESPLHLRLAAELEELKGLSSGVQNGPTTRTKRKKTSKL